MQYAVTLGRTAGTGTLQAKSLTKGKRVQARRPGAAAALSRLSVVATRWAPQAGRARRAAVHGGSETQAPTGGPGRAAPAPGGYAGRSSRHRAQQPSKDHRTWSAPRRLPTPRASLRADVQHRQHDDRRGRPEKWVHRARLPRLVDSRRATRTGPS
nr:hypothetical protein [Angustibacter aerolatus]